MIRYIISALIISALMLAGCGGGNASSSRTDEQAIGTASGRAFVTCFSSHAKIPTANIAQADFAEDGGSWVSGTAGPNIKTLYGTDCGAPTIPLTAKERAAAQAVVTTYTNSLR